MNQRMMIQLEVEKNGRMYRMYVPMEQQPYAEAHEVALEFANQIVELEAQARKRAEDAAKPAEEVTAELVEPAQPQG